MYARNIQVKVPKTNVMWTDQYPYLGNCAPTPPLTQHVLSYRYFKWALCTIRSHGTKLNILVSKLRSGTSKTKAGPGELVRVALFWKSHCATCSPVYIILYHVTGSCKGPIASIRTLSMKQNEVNSCTIIVSKDTKSAKSRYSSSYKFISSKNKMKVLPTRLFQ